MVRRREEEGKKEGRRREEEGKKRERRREAGEKERGSMRSEGDIGCQPLDDLRRKVLGEAKVLQTVQVAVQTAIVHDGLGLIIVDIRMATQLLKV